MRPALPLFALLVVVTGTGRTPADSLWERRNPYFAYMHEDIRPRRVGDILTVVVSEATLFDGKENRNLNKKTLANFLFSLAGSTQGGASERSFRTTLQGNTTSNRALAGISDYKSQRLFTDRMGVVVIEVLPNGNLVIEGVRKRVVANETKMLRLRGIVRPRDVLEDNTVLSQYVANLEVSYLGRGIETDYLRNGWLGRIFNKIWPY
ncbi:MAG: flagellar basal body L-ring protein FlgH [Gemmataceae bacterium]|nr:flagellar basal body L-ring protein FlgH [Gemmataceae bacterium]